MEKKAYFILFSPVVLRSPNAEYSLEREGLRGRLDPRPEPTGSTLFFAASFAPSDSDRELAEYWTGAHRPGSTLA